jgi:hypothetical protein
MRAGKTLEPFESIWRARFADDDDRQPNSSSADTRIARRLKQATSFFINRAEAEARPRIRAARRTAVANHANFFLARLQYAVSQAAGKHCRMVNPAMAETATARCRF